MHYFSNYVNYTIQASTSSSLSFVLVDTGKSLIRRFSVRIQASKSYLYFSLLYTLRKHSATISTQPLTIGIANATYGSIKIVSNVYIIGFATPPLRNRHIALEKYELYSTTLQRQVRNPCIWLMKVIMYHLKESLMLDISQVV